jgi:hypothetical protein
MKFLDKKKRNQERKKWILVILVCILTSFFYANQFSKNSMAYQLFNPFYTWSRAEENPIRHIVTKFVPQDIPDRLKEWR